ncbi:hypothetical protein F8388_024717 [Cannabis sativa]|uniref:NET domain-containing protein n=1 Tax=Cannabis sativa TaxID=3483 RepID=A0A7J6GBW4_CANSA|nr:hypothetical protein F8388_024717 [Cannabis sativa]
MTYNPKGHDIYTMAEQLLASSWDHVEPERPKREEPSFRAEKKQEPERIPAPASSSNPTPPPPIPPPSVQSPVRTPSPMKAPPVKPLKQPKSKAKDPNKREMNMKEKHKLGVGLQSLPQEKMEQVVQIIKKRNEHLKQDGDEIEERERERERDMVSWFWG